MRKLRLLIVDDEPLIRNGIRRILSTVDGIELVAEAGSGKEAVHAIFAERPDLVLLDVEMSDCSGLDVVREVGVKRMPPVIFVTAHDDYAVNAFELNAVDYVLKPFEDVRLRESIERARTRISAQNEAAFSEKLQALLESQTRRWAERLVVRNGDRFEFVATDSVDWLESENNYVRLHCGSREHLLGETLSNLESRLDPAKFVRIHRGRIANASRIVAVHLLFNGTYELELRGGVRITSGRLYKDTVRKLIRA